MNLVGCRVVLWRTALPKGLFRCVRAGDHTLASARRRRIRIDRLNTAGAFIMGRNMFGPVRGEWDRPRMNQAS
jgi:hypothetical protein